jgi:hypothetical protein
VLIREGDSSIGSGQFILAALSTLFGWALLDRCCSAGAMVAATGWCHG